MFAIDYEDFVTPVPAESGEVAGEGQRRAEELGFAGPGDSYGRLATSSARRWLAILIELCHKLAREKLGRTFFA